MNYSGRFEAVCADTGRSICCSTSSPYSYSYGNSQDYEVLSDSSKILRKYFDMSMEFTKRGQLPGLICEYCNSCMIPKVGLYGMHVCPNCGGPSVAILGYILDVPITDSRDLWEVSRIYPEMAALKK